MLERAERVEGSLDERTARCRLGVERVKLREKGSPGGPGGNSAPNEKTAACYPTMSQQRIQPFRENLPSEGRSLDDVARA